MSKPIIAVTGINGQVGSDIHQIHHHFVDVFDFIFIDRSLMDLANPESITSFFKTNSPQFFINCAAYTAVDKAETEKELAQQINGFSVQQIAKHCKNINCILINVSTDYVFDGLKNAPYKPSDKSNPVNFYGQAKLFGEIETIKASSKNIVVRTAWVYNKTGKNFVNTMLRLMNEKPSINVVEDQIGSPTYSPNLAQALLQIVSKIYKSNYQIVYQNIYHYSNTGVISWYDFAVEIKNVIGSNCAVNPIPTTAYPTPAKRSAYSVMDCSDITKDFEIDLIDWKTSLQECLQITEEI